VTGWLNGRTEARFPKPAQRSRKPKRVIRRKAKRKAKLHDADKLFSQYIRTRDAWECRRCRSPFTPQCAHIVSRRYRSTRFSPDNAVTLCHKCHLHMTWRPLEWEVWVEEMFPGRLGILKARALAGVAKVDYDEVCESLKAALGVKT